MLKKAMNGKISWLNPKKETILGDYSIYFASQFDMEREMGFEPTTFCLGSKCSAN